ncbi:MAG: ketoacyl-ACP synthase III [Cryobacterium sp.]|nr:ketoacyl-ACP synthase III [Oligoflexia bacterium]
MKLYSSRIAGTGSAFPERVVTNEELCRWLENLPGEVPENFSPDWIFERTGIKTRHLARSGETVSELAFLASVRALSKAGILDKDIDGILVATCTPEQPLPASATFLQMKLGATRAFALDVNAACSGFQHAWALAHAMVASGQAKNMLVVGADVLSSVTDYTDRKSAILFGDGAGAVVITRDENLENAPRFSLSADGREWDLFQVPAGGSAKPAFGIDPRDKAEISYSQTRMQMKGTEIFKSSVRTMVDLSAKLLTELGLSVSDIDFVVPHQANLRILEAVARKTQIPLAKFILNIETRGNTSAATVPTALDEGFRSGRILPGHRILVPVFGAGTTSGVTIARIS